MGRLASKVTRRIAGFVLLCVAVGLTTCSALEAVKTSQGGVKIFGAAPIVIVPAPVAVSL
jgi:hypothetical protein